GGLQEDKPQSRHTQVQTRHQSADIAARSTTIPHHVWKTYPRIGSVCCYELFCLHGLIEQSSHVHRVLRPACNGPIFWSTVSGNRGGFLEKLSDVFSIASI